MKRKGDKFDLIIKYIFIFLVASAIGRFYEFYLVLGEGTLNYYHYFPTSIYTLIFALPYGIAIMLIYFAFKFLDEYKIKSFALRVITGTGLIILAELVTGLIGIKIAGVMPWDYTDHILNYKGLISLPISIRWIILVTIIGKLGYKKIGDFMKRSLSKKIKNLTIATLIIWGIYLIAFFGAKNFGVI